MMMDATDYTCPLCTHAFSGANCHSSCPMSKGCKMIRCPRCGYEFVEEGIVANWLRRILRGRSKSTEANR